MGASTGWQLWHFSDAQKAFAVRRRLKGKVPVSDLADVPNPTETELPRGRTGTGFPTTRVQAVDYIQSWTERADAPSELPAKRLLRWLELSTRRFHPGKDRHDQDNEQNGQVPRDWRLVHWRSDVALTGSDLALTQVGKPSRHDTAVFVAACHQPPVNSQTAEFQFCR